MSPDTGNNIGLNPVLLCCHFQVYRSAAFQQKIIIEENLVGHGVIDKRPSDVGRKINMICQPLKIMKRQARRHFPHSGKFFITYHLAEGGGSYPVWGDKVIQKETYANSFWSYVIFFLSIGNWNNHKYRKQYGEYLLHKEIVWLEN